MSGFDLRCHSCSHAIGMVTMPMQIMGVFKRSMAGRMAKSHPHEIRRWCRSCGWVNVFHPPRITDQIETK